MSCCEMDILVNFQSPQVSIVIIAVDSFQQSQMKNLICVYSQYKIDTSPPSSPPTPQKTEEKVNHWITFSHPDFNCLSLVQ